ncbi:hypothetical protein AA309_11100 [Microvirga vignae]|uniref:Uncharacterized protein n=1 Tax=Microvirga vignae TaxID=1225564 RepID=A0A0H1RD12_9HYPH|nr:hypothetical protein AA309_11100 [Microvirga vignae]
MGGVMFRIEDELTEYNDLNQRRRIKDLVDAIDQLSEALQVGPDQLISTLTGLVRRRDSFERLKTRFDIRYL